MNVFDPAILDGGSQLSSLLFINNLCTRANIFDVRGDLAATRAALSNCTSNFELEPTLSCTYDRMITGRIYWCQLTAVNPAGLDNFERVGGNHLPGGNDDAVMYISAQNQNTRVIPSVICQQFQSLQILDMINNQLDEITDQTFRGCAFLTELMILRNNIRRIPNRAFSSARNLHTLFLDANRIEFIERAAFEGTRIELLDLTMNEIHRFEREVFLPIASTLRILRLNDNKLEMLPPNAFHGLDNLIDLELNHNHFFSLPTGVFNPLVNLQILQLANCGLERLQPTLFSGLNNLVDLELGLNDLDFLPDGVFDLPNLRLLGLVQNNFRTLDAAVFGRSLNTLEFIDASINRIRSVDPDIINRSARLLDLDLAFNDCVDRRFIDVPQFRNEILDSLETCVRSFNNVTISCNFSVEGETIYECQLTIDNTNDRQRFERVEGQHTEERNDNWVTHVRGEFWDGSGIWGENPKILGTSVRQKP